MRKMKNLFKTFGVIALIALIGFLMVSCEEDEANNNSLEQTRVGTITITGLSSYEGNYVNVIVFPAGGAAVGANQNFTKINNPTVVIDFFKTEFGTFNPNGIYNVNIDIFKINKYVQDSMLTNNGNRGHDTKFTDSFATISY